MFIPCVGYSFSLGSADVQIIGPVDVSDNSNDSSLVIRMEYGDTSFLFMGDAEENEEVSIIEKWGDIRADVIKIGHHGSAGSTGQYLLSKVQPEYAVISVGKENSYGHPSEEVLDRLNKENVEIFRTDLQGDIFCYSDGKQVTFSTEKKADPKLLLKSGDELTEFWANQSESAKKRDETEVSAQGIQRYILNTNTMKFHRPECTSVGDIRKKNKKEVEEKRDELIQEGYSPCKICNP